MLSQGHVVAPLYHYTGQVAPRFGDSGYLRSENDATASWLRLIFTSDHFIHTYQTYIMCLSHWYAVSSAHGCILIPLHWPSCPQIWGFSDATTSWLRLIFTSDHIIHPYQTYTKCLSDWYAVSRAYGCPLILLHRPSWPQIWEVRFTLGVEMMP